MSDHCQKGLCGFDACVCDCAGCAKAKRSDSCEAKEIEWLCGLLLLQVSYDKHHLVHELETLARRLLAEARGAEYNEGLMRTDLIAAEERIASLEREVASYEGMSAAVDHYQEEVRRLERENESLRRFKASVDEALNSGDGVYRP